MEALQQIALTDLAGKWYVLFTNFPMWLKGDKTNPAFHYSIETKGNLTGLRDIVTYKNKSGEEKSIKGFDTPDDASNTSFTWRGEGLLALFKSKWKIIHYNAEKEWAIIYFSKTLATPEGYDVISKKPVLEETEINIIQVLLQELMAGNVTGITH